MKKLLLASIFVIVISGLYLLKNKSEQPNLLVDEQKVTIKNDNDIAKILPQKTDDQIPKPLLSNLNFQKKYPKLDESQKNFLKSFDENDFDRAVAQGLLLSRLDQKSETVKELFQVLLSNPRASVKSLVKAIQYKGLTGMELEKSALMDLAKQLAVDEESIVHVKNCAKQELENISKSLPQVEDVDLVSGQREISYVQGLSPQESTKFGTVLTYFNNALANLDQNLKQDEAISLLKSEQNPVIRHLLAKNFYFENKEKISSHTLEELKRIGFNPSN
jgi:hypothetical protein